MPGWVLVAVWGWWPFFHVGDIDVKGRHRQRKVRIKREQASAGEGRRNLKTQISVFDFNIVKLLILHSASGGVTGHLIFVSC